MKLLLHLACLALAAASSAAGVSTKVLDFVSYVNGILDNELQTQQLGDDHASIQARNVPVDIKCFRPASRDNPVLFAEEAVNEVIQVLLFYVLTEDIEDTVSLTYYTFANQSNYKPGEFKVESLYNMSCGAFHKVENCTGSYRVAKGYVFGNFPECSYTVGGNHPRFTSFHSCDSVTGTAPQNTEQPSPIEPFELLYKEPKFPVINPPKGYVAPCGSKVENVTNVTTHNASSSRR